jgi:hypothetical protein
MATARSQPKPKPMVTNSFGSLKLFVFEIFEKFSFI